MAIQSRRLVLAKKPEGKAQIALGKPDSTFKLETVELPDLKDNQVLVDTALISCDPAQRTWISAFSKPDRMYTTPVNEGDVMRAGFLGTVLESKASHLKKGDVVYSARDPGLGWQDKAILGAEALTALQPPPGMGYSTFLSLLGTTGLTAYFGLIEVCKLQKGQSIVVSGAAGAVGQVVCQYAKHVIGASKVIAIAGTDDKCSLMQKLGADVALNYKSGDFYQDLEKATDGFVDCYWDNVGGEILSFMLKRVKRFGRIAACGAISAYDNDNPVDIQNWTEIILNRLTVQGFIVVDYLDRLKEGREALGKALAEGKLAKEGHETIVKVDLEGIPAAWFKLFEGGNQGKLILQLKDLDEKSKM